MSPNISDFEPFVTRAREIAESLKTPVVLDVHGSSEHYTVPSGTATADLFTMSVDKSTHIPATESVLIRDHRNKKYFTPELRQKTTTACWRQTHLWNDCTFLCNALLFDFKISKSVNAIAFFDKFRTMFNMILPKLSDGRPFTDCLSIDFFRTSAHIKTKVKQGEFLLKIFKFLDKFAFIPLYFLSSLDSPIPIRPSDLNPELYAALNQLMGNSFVPDVNELFQRIRVRVNKLGHATLTPSAVVPSVFPETEPSYLVNFFERRHLYEFCQFVKNAGNTNRIVGYSGKTRDELLTLIRNFENAHKNIFDSFLQIFVNKRHTFSYRGVEIGGEKKNIRREERLCDHYEKIYFQIWARLLLLLLQGLDFWFADTDVEQQPKNFKLMRNLTKTFVQTCEPFFQRVFLTSSVGFQENLFYLMKFTESYREIGSSYVAQELIKRFVGAWQSYATKLQKHRDSGAKGDFFPRPPGYRPSGSQFGIFFPKEIFSSRSFREHLQSTCRVRRRSKMSGNRPRIIKEISITAIIPFPNSHSELLPKNIRIRLVPQYNKRSRFLINKYAKLGVAQFKGWAITEFLKRFRGVQFVPLGESGEYRLNVAYVADVNKIKSKQGRAVAGDLGFKKILVTAPNFGDYPRIYDGAPIRRANYIYLTNGQRQQRERDITKHIMDESEKRGASLLTVAQEQLESFKRDVHYNTLRPFVNACQNSGVRRNRRLNVLARIITSTNWNPEHKHLSVLRKDLYGLLKRFSENMESFLGQNCNTKQFYREFSREQRIFIRETNHLLYCLEYNILKILRKIVFLIDFIDRLAKLPPPKRRAWVQKLNLSAYKKWYFIANKRKRRVRDQIYKIARNLINYCIANKVDLVVFGYNKGWKKSNLARRFNQYWGLLPVAELLKRIKYLAKKYGIQFKTVNESYTSIASAVLEEPLSSSGERLSVRGPKMVGKNGNPYDARGLIRFSVGDRKLYMHSDANAAFNMFRKYVQNIQRYNNRVGRNRSTLPEIDYFAPLRKSRGWMLKTPKTIYLNKQKLRKGKRNKKRRRMGNLSPSSVVRRS